MKIAVFSTQGFERYTLDDANKQFGEQLDRSLDAILVKSGRTSKQTSSFVITSVAALPSALVDVTVRIRVSPPVMWQPRKSVADLPFTPSASKR